MKSLIKVLAFFGLGSLMSACSAQADNQVSPHDPVMAKEGDTFYLYSTGPGITFYMSEDLENWRRGGRVFPGEPDWARDVAPEFNGHLWAPDIVERDGTWYLYYSVSAFGRNTSGIGVTTNTTLDPNHPDYEWVDQGIVVQSVPYRDMWNAIDPAVAFEEDGTPWMTFGSFWGGMKLVKLDDNMIDLAEPQEWHTIAKRERSILIDDAQAGPAEIEGPFIYQKGDYYYLFISIGLCCRGEDSTYRMKVGRSQDIRGPYLDRDGVDMNQEGGTLVLGPNDEYYGVGHNSAYTFDGVDYLVFHAYEAADNGRQKLKIAEMQWQDGWPVVDESVLSEYFSELHED
ncbi:arabinan endo-1,5-alpha-L-arabinosidase [Marinimicrobium alkaliphilum]|uniref:arabinan endo-1,5-alpha-L-arabinosidase n=1 Tax=Marinimicrobium alkaliphilum TaxID=2202654 RepID=UPI000DBA0B48|nr:arabinan endo-1,5-alpha-L-arabinosidase [Marinimicrobium alkaliphilum]